MDLDSTQCTELDAESVDDGCLEDGEPPETSTVAETSELASAAPYQVAVANEQPHAFVDVQAVIAAIRQALAVAGVSEAAVSVAIVDDETIHELNREFLQHDYPTDVLSFVLSEANESLVGEIIVSADTAFREAGSLDWPPSCELLLYVIHGALHLAGYRDKNERDSQRMHRAEATVLEALGIQRLATDDRWHAIPPAAVLPQPSQPMAASQPTKGAASQ